MIRINITQTKLYPCNSLKLNHLTSLCDDLCALSEEECC